MGPTNGGSRAGAVRFFAVSELKHRWRSLVALGLMAGLAAGLALAAVAGARRTATAYTRFRQATNAPDAFVFGTQLGVGDWDYSPVVQLPEVLDWGTFTLAPVGMAEPVLGTLAPGDDRLYRTISRPLLVGGRLPDPRRADEVLVNRAAASQFDLRLGRRVTVVASTNLEDFFRSAHERIDQGHRVEATVVGIGDSAMDQAFGPTEPGFVPSAGLLARFPDVPRPPNLVVRLRPGTDVKAFQMRAAATMGLPDVPVRDLAEDRKRIVHATDLERAGLLFFAAAVAVAAFVLVGQALTRAAYGIAESGSALRALGFTKPDLTAAVVLPMGLTALVAGGASVAGAALFSGSRSAWPASWIPTSASTPTGSCWDPAPCSSRCWCWPVPRSRGTGRPPPPPAGAPARSRPPWCAAFVPLAGSPSR